MEAVDGGGCEGGLMVELGRICGLHFGKARALISSRPWRRKERVVVAVVNGGDEPFVDLEFCDSFEVWEPVEEQVCEVGWPWP